MSARYSAADYAAAGRALLPRGRVWPAGPETVQGKVLGAIARTFERSDAAACSLLDQARPGTGTMQLAAWQSTLGLRSGGADERQLNALRARFVGAGGQSAADYIRFAAELGFVITITTYRAPRDGESLAGPPYSSAAWPFCWGVSIRENTGGLTPAHLLAELDAIKPAETIVFLL